MENSVSPFPSSPSPPCSPSLLFSAPLLAPCLPRFCTRILIHFYSVLMLLAPLLSWPLVQLMCLPGVHSETADGLAGALAGCSDASGPVLPQSRKKKKKSKRPVKLCCWCLSRTNRRQCGNAYCMKDVCDAHLQRRWLDGGPSALRYCPYCMEGPVKGS